jgi:hypothetical protein
MMDLSDADPKGLVRESYAIEGITGDECKSIFIDWALSLKAADPHEAMRALLAHYGTGEPSHPMTAILTLGLTAPAKPQRRGGRMGRGVGV